MKLWRTPSPAGRPACRPGIGSWPSPGVRTRLATALLLAMLLLAPMLPVTHPAAAQAAAAAPEPPGAVVELLRLRVPLEQRQAWMAAERASWLPWLERQPGFLGKRVYWDPGRQEAVVLIRWSHREQWKEIPPQEVARVQRRFERQARLQLRRQGFSPAGEGNPFPLVAEGEWMELPGAHQDPAPFNGPSASAQDG